MKRTLVLLAFLTGTFTSNAQLLWKISGNGLPKSSYILGTHHVASSDVCDMIAGFDQAYQSIEQVYGEVETDLMNSTSAQMKVLAHTFMPKGQTLSSLYNEEETAKINQFLKSTIGAELSAFDKLKPVALSSTIQMLLAQKIFPDFDATKAIDAHMQTMAKQDNKAAKGLETLEFQINLLYDSPLEEQAEELLKMAEMGAKAEESIIKLTENYLKQDLEGLLEIMLEDSEPGELDDILYNRNRNWIVQMKDIMPQAPTMFVVGAGHLPGELGVLNLLKEEGYTVEAVW
jgi:uncharacterized protein YbaP (TraB family)